MSITDDVGGAYVCDPVRHPECPKTWCGYADGGHQDRCLCTLYLGAARLGPDGRPMVPPLEGWELSAAASRHDWDALEALNARYARFAEDLLRELGLTKNLLERGG